MGATALIAMLVVAGGLQSPSATVVFVCEHGAAKSRTSTSWRQSMA
jgi:hypothetical protein